MSPPAKKIVLQLGLENPTPSDLVYKPPLQHETPSDTPTPQSEIQVAYLEETESDSTDDTPSTPPSTSASLCLARASDPTSVVVQPYGCTLHSCVHGSPPPTPSYSRGSPLIRRSFAIPSAFVCFSSKSPGEEIKVIQQLLIRDLSSEYGIHITASEMGRGNLPKWVESQCRDATAVLCVCNKALFEEWEQPNTVIHCVGRQVYAAANEGGRKPEKFTVVLLKQSDRQFIPSSYLRDIQAFIVTEVRDIACFIRNVLCNAYALIYTLSCFTRHMFGFGILISMQSIGHCNIGTRQYRLYITGKNFLNFLKCVTGKFKCDRKSGISGTG